MATLSPDERVAFFVVGSAGMLELRMRKLGKWIEWWYNIG